MELQVPELDDRGYRSLCLENGLRVLLVSDETSEKGAAALSVRAGSLLDPDECTGLAHFCEHMAFLGTEKYPNENDYSAFLSAHGGASNAYTDQEETAYHFDVRGEDLEGALDRFAQFFVAPLFTESATDRELNAIHSEHEKNIQQDFWRSFQLRKNQAREGHPFRKFSTGNLETLKTMPSASGVDIREELLRFHGEYYSANIMKLAIVGPQSLDTLEGWVRTMFSPIVNKNIDVPTFPGEPYSQEQLGKRVSIVPVRDLHSIEIAFPMPPVDHLYKSKPDGYLSHLLGHEGEGSVLSLLKARGWANGLIAGTAFAYTDWSMFSVLVEATPVGMEHVEEVIEVIFQYIAMLKEEGAKEWIWQEKQLLSNIEFRFLNKSQPIHYAIRLATDMHRFEEPHFVSGPYLSFEYEPGHIDTLLACLHPDNMICTVSDRSFEERASETEKWYGTRYTIEDLDAQTLQRWRDTQRIPELHLPAPNEFIATDLDLKPREIAEEVALGVEMAIRNSDNGTAGADKGRAGGVPPASDPLRSHMHLHTSELYGHLPRLLRDLPGLRVWFKQDDKFERPKLGFAIRLLSFAAYNSPEVVNEARIFTLMIKEHLNEFSYDAELAGLEFDVTNHFSGISLTLFGYHDKLSVLLHKILESLRSDAVLAQAVFDRMKDRIARDYENFLFEQAYFHAYYFTLCCLETPRWSHIDKAKVLPQMTLDDVRYFAQRFLGRLHVEVFAHGNASAQEALELAHSVRETLQTEPVLPSMMPLQRCVQLKPRTRYLCQSRSLDPDNTNSALHNTYFFGPIDDVDQARLRVLVQIMTEPAFTQLRTKEQLGYIVHAGTINYAKVGHALRVIVQSSTRDPVYIHDRVESFLHAFRNNDLQDLTDEDFASYTSAVQERLLEKPKNLNEETARHMSIINRDTYHFREREVQARITAELKREDVLAFFDKYVAMDGTHRSVLSAQVFGRDQRLPGEPAPEPSSDGVEAKEEAEEQESQSQPETGAEAEAEAGADGGNEGDVEGDADADPEAEEVELLPPPPDTCEVVIIEDPVQFPQRMPLLPVEAVVAATDGESNCGGSDDTSGTAAADETS